MLVSLEIQCPELATLVGGAVIVTERSVGSLAEYSCLAGFTLVGPDQRTCQTSGNWSETSPTCEGEELRIHHHHFSL